MTTTAIIAVAYNKVNSLLRLLDSLNDAQYNGEQVPLIISIDNSGLNEVENAAKQFVWKHGRKEIRTFSERQGLRKHILSCGDFLEQYETVYVFEDDIIASPYFYIYGKKCMEQYGDDDRIEGISLYAPQWNQNANFPFEPLKTEYDTYFMQYAQSWGQIWFRDKWKKFIEWYRDNTDFFERQKHPEVPQILYTWGNNSWLKYHIAYCALKKRYFVYPYFSYTSTFVESGTHFGTDITRYHSNFMVCNPGEIKLPVLDGSAVCYDAFFENLKTVLWLDGKYQDVAIDLYGCQSGDKKNTYLLTTKSMPFKLEREYGLQLHPVELNILYRMNGKGIFLYNTGQSGRAVRKKDRNADVVKRWDYFMKDRFLLWDELLPVVWRKFHNLLHIIRSRK